MKLVDHNLALNRPVSLLNTGDVHLNIAGAGQVPAASDNPAPALEIPVRVRSSGGSVNLSNPRAIFAGSPPRFTRSRVTYEAYVVSRTSTRPQVDSVMLGACPAGTDPLTAPTNHSAHAVFDDAVLADGAALYAELALRRLARG